MFFFSRVNLVLAGLCQEEYLGQDPHHSFLHLPRKFPEQPGAVLKEFWSTWFVAVSHHSSTQKN